MDGAGDKTNFLFTSSSLILCLLCSNENISSLFYSPSLPSPVPLYFPPSPSLLRPSFLSSFFSSLLSSLSPTAPMRHFEIAFKMFDLNGDGEVDYGEFEKVSPQQAKPIHRCRDMYKYSIVWLASFPGSCVLLGHWGQEN